ncbi:MAG: hypothetical protein ACREYD_04200 [Casimicrobiaceae bacterium]
MIAPHHAPQRISTRVADNQAKLARFVLLSMLLHAAVIALFGTSHSGPGGGNRALDDVLDVTLRRLTVQPEAASTPSPAGSTDAGTVPRNDRVPRPPATPERGAGSPAIEVPGSGTAAGDRAPTEAPVSPPEPQTTSPQQASDALPRIDLRAPEEVDKPLAPPLSAPPSIERLAPPPVAPPLAAPFELAPLTLPPAIEHLARPASQHALAPPVELAPREAPVVPALPIERLAAPAPQRALAPPVELAPRVEMPIPVAPAERLRPPAMQPELAAPIELEPVPPAPVLSAPIDRLGAPRIERELAPAPAVVTPSPPTAPIPAPAAKPPAATTPDLEPGAPAVAARQRPATPSPEARDATVPPAAGELPRLRFGAPAAEDDIFRPRRDVVVPSPEPGGAPHIDLDAARQRARGIASETGGTHGILPALPPPPERKSKESLALEKAIKPDCRTAYANMGLLAVPALVVSTLGDGGCRW